VTFDDLAAARDGITQAVMLSRIHARTADGRWLSGLDVFEAVYRAAGFATLARLFGSRTLRPLFDRIYPWIAANRPRLSRLGLHRVFGAAAPVGVSDPQRLRDCNACRAQSLPGR
jgi:predicted DCC family thiol-disulfide oxidoreductase YuxK